MERVGFGPRFWAYALDLVFAAVGGALFSLVFGGAVGGSLGGLAGGATAGVPGMAAGALLGSMVGAVVALGLSVLVAVPAYGLIEALTGRSLGKMCLGLAVRRPDGGPADRGVLLLRYALKHSAFLSGLLGVLTGFLFLSALSSVLYFGFLLGCLAALNYNKQALHDILAGTAVYGWGAKNR